MQFLSALNPDQRSAVEHPGGPALVLAGAGSGKTRVLTTRVAWLLEQEQASINQIMLVTFTNKAAHEMQQRVHQLTTQKLPFAGTFHSLSAKILRRDGVAIGLSPNFTIYDSDDQMSLIKDLYKKHGFSTKQYHPNGVKNAISNAKNEMIDPAEYQTFAKGGFQQHTARVFELYQQALRQQQAVDFDDLLLLTVKLLQSNKSILGKYQDRARFLLIDEYQDTNKVQYELTKLLSAQHQELFVVGDFAQSIYAWRGADYRNMMNLKLDYPDLQEYKLEQNYRSTQTILDAATGVISQTDEHPILELWTDKPASEKIICIESPTSEDEASTILRHITRLQKYSLNDVAILYRTNAQSRPFEEACIRYGIPYTLVGGFKFYERKEVKDLLGYIRVIVNPLDEVSRNRVLKNGKRRWQKLKAWLEEQGWVDTFETDAAADYQNPILTAMTPHEVLQAIFEQTKYQDKFDVKDPDDLSRIENMNELLNVATSFESLPLFLENIALVQDNTMGDVVGQEENSKPTLTLMSLHSAKGLEFPVVVLAGMEEGLLPHSRSLLDPKQLEEERRLCYVGITRAQDILILSYAHKRWQYGSSHYTTRSRFLADIPNHAIKYQGGNQQQPSQNRFAPTSKPKVSAGRTIIDDDQLDALLNGELDVDSFIN